MCLTFTWWWWLIDVSGVATDSDSRVTVHTVQGWTSHPRRTAMSSGVLETSSRASTHTPFRIARLTPFASPSNAALCTAHRPYQYIKVCKPSPKQKTVQCACACMCVCVCVCEQDVEGAHRCSVVLSPVGFPLVLRTPSPVSSASSAIG